MLHHRRGGEWQGSQQWRQCRATGGARPGTVPPERPVHPPPSTDNLLTRYNFLLLSYHPLKKGLLSPWLVRRPLWGRTAAAAAAAAAAASAISDKYCMMSVYIPATKENTCWTYNMSWGHSGHHHIYIPGFPSLRRGRRGGSSCRRGWV